MNSFIFDEELRASLGSRLEQCPRSFVPFCQAASNVNPRRILEIGYCYGGTARMWQTLVPSDGFVVSVDPREPDTLSLPPVKLLENPTHHFIIGESQNSEIVEEVRCLAPFDVLFIDGDHSYGGVKSDYENYGPMVRSGGIIGFHDHGHAPILKLWNEIDVPNKIVLQGAQSIGYFVKE